MPAFLEKLRRRSSRIARPNGEQNQQVLDEQVANGQNGSNGHGLSHRVSASTLNSSQVGSPSQSTTPATSTTEDFTTQTKDNTYGPTPLPSRPQRPSVDPVKRYSMNVRCIVPQCGS